MKLAAAVTGIALLTASMAFAGATKTYQVTGPVLEVKDDKIVVQKGTEKWEIAKDKDSKVTGEQQAATELRSQLAQLQTERDQSARQGAAEIAELEQRLRQAVVSLARATADLAQEHGRRERTDPVSGVEAGETGARHRLK